VLAGIAPGSRAAPEHLHIVRAGHAGKLEANEVSSSSWKTCARLRAPVLRYVLLDWQLPSSPAAALAGLRSERSGGWSWGEVGSATGTLR